MHPIVHPVVGYLCYAATARNRGGDRPDGGPAAVAVVAAAVPDLIDKPLLLAGVTPVGRRFAHSLLVAVPVVVVAWMLARRRGRRALGIAVAVGYLSHLAADVPWHVLSGEYDELGFLLWPITEMPEYTGTKALGTVAGVDVTTLWIEAAIGIVGIGLWWHDGRPGLERLRRSKR